MRNLTVLLASLAVLTGLTVLQSPSLASPVTGVITGTITSSGGGIPGVSTGGAVSGSYAYDTSSTDTTILGPGNPLTAFSLTIGTNPFVFDLGDLQTGGSVTPSIVPGKSTPTVDELFFFFDFAIISAFTGSTVIQQTVANAPPETYALDVTLPADAFTIAFAATPTIATVPEPSSLALVGLAMAGAFVTSRRRLARNRTQPTRRPLPVALAS